MAAANGLLDRILADMKAPSREAEREKAPVAGEGGYQSPNLLLSAPDDEGYRGAESVQPERWWGVPNSESAWSMRTEIDGEGYQGPIKWRQNGRGRIQKRL
jgi:hypothetical protein